MGFIIILILVTAAIACSAAFFSIYGLAQIFAGAFWPVVIMASSLEAGKLVTASYLYRYWKTTSEVLKYYLVAATVILMIITSAGIFGFLSSAYQSDILPVKQKHQQIELLTQQKNDLEELRTQRNARKKQIDSEVAALPSDYVGGRKRLIATYAPEVAQLQRDIATYDQGIQERTLKIAELSNDVLQVEAHVGPIIFIADAFGKSVDDATKWLILLLIAAFDPLAVALTIGVNKALLEHKASKETKKQEAIQPSAPLEVLSPAPNYYMPTQAPVVEKTVPAPINNNVEPIFDIFESTAGSDDDQDVDGDDLNGSDEHEEISDVLSEPEPSIVDISQLNPPTEVEPVEVAEEVDQPEEPVEEPSQEPEEQPVTAVERPHPVVSPTPQPQRDFSITVRDPYKVPAPKVYAPHTYGK